MLAIAHGNTVGAKAADHRVFAVAKGNAVGAAQVGCRGGDVFQQRTGDIHADLAVIPKHNAVAVTGGNAVSAHAADDQRIAIARDDGVGATAGGIAVAAHEPEGKTLHIEVGLAVVAHDHVIAGAGADAICAETTDDVLVAVAKVQLVVAAQARQGRCDLLEYGAARVHAHPAVVPKYSRVAGAGRDAVAAHASDDGVAAAAQENGIGPAAGCGRVGALVQGRQAGRVVIDLAVVAKDGVVASARAKVVGAIAAHNNFIAAAHADPVVAAQAQGAGSDACVRQAVGAHLDAAVIGQDGIAAVSGGNVVRAHAAQDGVGAVARHNDICAAGRCLGVERSEEHGRAGSIGKQLAIVAKYNMAPGAQGDAVGPEAAHDVLVAVAQCDDVVPTL